MSGPRTSWQHNQLRPACVARNVRRLAPRLCAPVGREHVGGTLFLCVQLMVSFWLESRAPVMEFLAASG